MNTAAYKTILDLYKNARQHRDNHPAHDPKGKHIPAEILAQYKPLCETVATYGAALRGANSPALYANQPQSHPEASAYTAALQLAEAVHSLLCWADSEEEAQFQAIFGDTDNTAAKTHAARAAQLRQLVEKIQPARHFLHATPAQLFVRLDISGGVLQAIHTDATQAQPVDFFVWDADEEEVGKANLWQHRHAEHADAARVYATRQEAFQQATAEKNEEEFYPSDTAESLERSEKAYKKVHSPEPSTFATNADLYDDGTPQGQEIAAALQDGRSIRVIPVD